MTTRIKLINSACGDLQEGKLYCIACTSGVDRLSILAEVAIDVLSWHSGLVIISNEYERLSLIEQLKQCYRSSGKYSSALSLWADYQPASSYNHIHNTLERIISRDRNLLHVLIVDNLLKIDTDFTCKEHHLRIAANLYLLRMIAVEYDIPVIVFTEYSFDNSICTVFSDSEYIERLTIYRFPRERIPKPTRNGTLFLSTDKRRKQSAELELPLFITYFTQ